MHELLRVYASEVAGDSEPERRRALARMLDHYLHTAYAADRLRDSQRDEIALSAPEAGVVIEELADHRQALEWFTSDHRALLSALRLAAARGFEAHTYQLAWTMANYLYRQGHWHDHTAAHTVALAAAQRLGDLIAQSRAHTSLSGVESRLGRLRIAQRHSCEAVALAARTGDLVEQARAQRSLAFMLARRGRLAEAVVNAKETLALYRAVGHRRGEANALNAVGWYYGLLGAHEQSVVLCEQALALQCAVGDVHGIADTWDSLGYARHRLGDDAKAVSCFAEALRGYRQIGSLYGEAGTLTRLGDAHHAFGRLAEAQAVWREALVIFEHLSRNEAEEVRVKLDRPPRSLKPKRGNDRRRLAAAAAPWQAHHSAAL